MKSDKKIVVVNTQHQTETIKASEKPTIEGPVTIWYHEKPCVDSQIVIASGMVVYQSNANRHGVMRFDAVEGIFASKIFDVAVSDLALYDYSAKLEAIHVFNWRYQLLQPTVKVHSIPDFGAKAVMVSATFESYDHKSGGRLLEWQKLGDDTITTVIDGLEIGPNVGFIDIFITKN